jgi:hypothetical protein
MPAPLVNLTSAPLVKSPLLSIMLVHPDLWGFWEWLGQTPRLGVNPKAFLLLLLLQVESCIVITITTITV